jgi:transposase
VHNGGAYGDGTTESDVSFGFGTARTAGKLGQLTFSVRRAKIILLSASGKNDREIAPQLETSRNTVGLWRRRFLAQGVSGLYDELRPGRPRPISDERVAQLVRKTLKTKPKAATHWSIHQIADETGYRNRRYIASGKHLVCSHIDKNISSSQAIHFL